MCQLRRANRHPCSGRWIALLTRTISTEGNMRTRFIFLALLWVPLGTNGFGQRGQTNGPHGGPVFCPTTSLDGGCGKSRLRESQIESASESSEIRGSSRSSVFRMGACFLHAIPGGALEQIAKPSSGYSIQTELSLSRAFGILLEADRIAFAGREQPTSPDDYYTMIMVTLTSWTIAGGAFVEWNLGDISFKLRGKCGGFLARVVGDSIYSMNRPLGLGNSQGESSDTYLFLSGSGIVITHVSDAVAIQWGVEFSGIVNSGWSFTALRLGLLFAFI
jgi:hypothetical protein